MTPLGVKDDIVNINNSKYLFKRVSTRNKTYIGLWNVSKSNLFVKKSNQKLY